ncbi:PREDICTED: cell division cycle-associated protein 3-like [Priapulus caudatus]|uniref:Cell division cycle-associated protein 3-like n=1 Tax=Priapulus caudatus TaxID=37621 RepID=A0ABM1DX21_PRICU|nr:PREDICTED: cell division cycle-associated protein 3-like [Priapulus caudatus]
MVFHEITQWQGRFKHKMGGVNTKEVVEALDATDSRTTPPHMGRKTILSTDPRSPTEEICRTPIVVDNSPSIDTPSSSIIAHRSRVLEEDPRSPSIEVSRTPIQVAETPDIHRNQPGVRHRPKHLHIGTTTPVHCAPRDPATEPASDPRSPTKTIARTPIQEDHVSVDLDDPRSPTGDIARTPVFTSELAADSQAEALARGEKTPAYHKLSESSDISSGDLVADGETTSLLPDESVGMKQLQPKKLFEKNAGGKMAAARAADTPKYLLQRRQSERLNSDLEGAAEDKENLTQS